MKVERLKEILAQLKELTTELEVELYSHPESYVLGVDYNEVLQYYNTNLLVRYTFILIYHLKRLEL